MEVFIFPELMYSLFLANTMSPDLWAWLSILVYRRIKEAASETNPEAQTIHYRSFRFNSIWTPGALQQKAENWLASQNDR